MNPNSTMLADQQGLVIIISGRTLDTRDLVWLSLVWFYSISTVVDHLKQIHFYTYKQSYFTQLYFKQFSLE